MSKINTTKFTNENSESDSEHSDGDQEGYAAKYSNVTLGFADGLITLDSDQTDYTISRIGGKPVLFPLKRTEEEKLKSNNVMEIKCLHCQNSMSFMLQIYAPLSSDDVPGRNDYDRVIYLWRCVQSQCKNKKDNIRALRVLRRLRQNATSSSSSSATKQPQSNTNNTSTSTQQNSFFSSTSTTSAFNPFAAGAQSQKESTGMNPFASSIFTPNSKPQALPALATPSSSTPPTDKMKDLNINSSASNAQNKDQKKTKARLTSNSKDEICSISSGDPVYKPIYLTTDYELLSDNKSTATTKVESLKGLSESAQQAIKEFNQSDEDDAEDTHPKSSDKSRRNNKKKSSTRTGNNGSNNEWADEAYEVQKLANIDDTFLKFVERIRKGGPTQCVRYERLGKPLFFTSADPTFSLLCPKYSATSSTASVNVTVTRTAYASPDAPSVNACARMRIYDSSKIETCSRCGGNRVFELQILPHILTELEKAGTILENTLSSEVDYNDIDWGTAFIFVCQNDCVDDDSDVTYREELVLIQKDT